jgi:hypothetical protein
MGPHRNGWRLNLLGGLTTLLMAVAVAAMLVSGPA